MDQLVPESRVTNSTRSPQQESPSAAKHPNSFLYRIVDAVRSPLVVTDDGLRIVLANRAFYRIFATNRANAVGKPLTVVAGHCLGGEELTGFFTSIEMGTAIIDDCTAEIALPELGGRILQFSAARVDQEPGEASQVLVQIEDITDRKRDEAEYISAKWRAERAKRQQAQLLAAASHELRQPMQALGLMRAILAKMLKKKQDTEGLSLVAQIKETADAMSGVLNTLLDINQLEAGVVQPEKEDFSIGGLLERLRVEFAYHAGAQGLGWRVVPSNLLVHSDPHLLEQIVRNLLSNAVKYTTAGKLLLGCRRRGDKLRIEVWDTGRGIPEVEIPSIFREFRRLDNSAGKGRRGFGLGLAIVRKFSDLLGHIVYVQSRPGKGSVFAIEVPLAAQVQEPPPQQQVVSIMPGAVRSTTILIVESEPKTREMLDRLFVGEGYRVLAAAKGDEAVSLALEVAKPDIIVAGYQLLDGSTGPQIVTELREAICQAVPAVVLTGSISSDSVREIAKGNCVQRSKPADADELLHLIQSLLTKAKASSIQTGESEGLHPRYNSTVVRPTIFVVDDDSAVREGMRELLGGDERWSVETYPSGELFLEKLGSRRDGVLVVDSQMPGLSGIDLLERLDLEGRVLPAIMVTGHADVRLAVRAMGAGVVAFLEKPVQFDELIGHIERALERARNAAARYRWHDTAMTLIGKLTPREREVMKLVIEGNANKQMAYRLGINQRTIETHRATIMKKLGARSLSDLIHVAIAAAPRHAGLRQEM